MAAIRQLMSQKKKVNLLACSNACVLGVGVIQHRYASYMALCDQLSRPPFRFVRFVTRSHLARRGRCARCVECTWTFPWSGGTGISARAPERGVAGGAVGTAVPPVRAAGAPARKPDMRQSPSLGTQKVAVMRSPMVANGRSASAR